MELIKLTADGLGKARRKQGAGENWERWRRSQADEEKERFGLLVCAAYKSLCCVSALLDHNSVIKAQLHCSGSYWLHLKRPNQFGFPLQQSRAALPMTPQNIQLLGSADGGWRAPRDGL